MIFDHIPKGLNTPLFFSEITVNGNSLNFNGSSGGEPQPPLISCAGATDTVETGGIWVNPTMEVNGIFYDYIDSIESILDFNDHGIETHWTFKNISDEFLRVKISGSVHENDQGWAMNTNPTLDVDWDSGVLTFCLAPAANISCTPDYIAFDSIETGIDSSKTYALTLEFVGPNGVVIYPKTTSVVEGNTGDASRDLSYALYQILWNKQVNNGVFLIVSSSGTQNPEGAYFQSFGGHIAGGSSSSVYPVTLNIYPSENLMGANADLFRFLVTTDGETFEDIIAVQSCGAQYFPGI
ncbi:hypothetical protein [Acinetobacter guerrae]|uniref:hypothetical protein n=1 Tax=Acinetobacter guerrae TaxID=1843371 RepID=UPI00128CF2C6|nr:hypothetical protein [Acinetobacter guerrae]MPW44731.1 hypothetical protein [Acinetobacter guerrae]